MTLCECGCGGEAKPGRRFISGHNIPIKKGTKLLEEAKQKRKEVRRINKEIKEGKRSAPELPFCVCGCGGRVAKPGNRFINGHENRGVNNPMYGVSLIPWNKGLTKETDETIRAMAEEKLILFRDKNNHPMYDKHHTEEAKLEISKTRKEFFQTEEGQEWLDKFMRGENSPRYGKGSWSKGLTKESDKRLEKLGEKTSIGLNEFFQTEEGKKLGEEISRTKKEFFATKDGQKWLDNNLRGENNGMYGKHHTEEAKQKIKEARLGKQLTEDHLRKILKAGCVSPNKKEQYIRWLLQVIFPKEYKFVGDGSVIIGRYCPDFININGQKKLIEFFGDYWHEGDDEGNRIFQFRLFGFDTLIIWEHELNDDEIEMTIAKIIEFHLR